MLHSESSRRAMTWLSSSEYMPVEGWKRNTPALVAMARPPRPRNHSKNILQALTSFLAPGGAPTLTVRLRVLLLLTNSLTMSPPRRSLPARIMEVDTMSRAASIAFLVLSLASRPPAETWMSAPSSNRL